MTGSASTITAQVFGARSQPGTATRPPVAEALVPREFLHVGEGHYGLAVDALGVSLEVTRLRRERGELVGEVTVKCSLPGAKTFNGVLASADMNLSSVRARQDRAKYFEKRAGGADIDWLDLLEEFCQRVITAERAGLPAVSLRDLPKPQADRVITVRGFPLLTTHPQALFGDGGNGKSLLAIYLAGELAHTGHRVAYFDYEMGGDDQRERLEAIYGAAMPDIRYVRCDRPLTHCIDHVRQVVRDERLTFAVFDSVAFACDGPPEAAEVAGRYFQALRQLGPLGTLHIAHITKAKEGGDRSHEKRPFGSTFWHNGFRSTWFAKATDPSPDGSRFTIGLFNEKANLGRRHGPVSFAVTFAEGQTTFTRASVTDSPELASRLTAKARVYAALRKGSLTKAELDDLLSEEDTPESIKKALQRLQKDNVVLQFPSPSGPGAAPRYGLAEKVRS